MKAISIGLVLMLNIYWLRVTLIHQSHRNIQTQAGRQTEEGRDNERRRDAKKGAETEVDISRSKQEDCR